MSTNIWELEKKKTKLKVKEKKLTSRANTNKSDESQERSNDGDNIGEKNSLTFQNRAIVRLSFDLAIFFSHSASHADLQSMVKGV